MTNGTGGFGCRYDPPELTMVAFDELPPIFRRIIREACFAMSPLTVHDIIRDMGRQRALEYLIEADEQVRADLRAEQEAFARIAA
jgi:hypothetical protein